MSNQTEEISLSGTYKKFFYQHWTSEKLYGATVQVEINLSPFCFHSISII